MSIQETKETCTKLVHQLLDKLKQAKTAQQKPLLMVFSTATCRPCKVQLRMFLDEYGDQIGIKFDMIQYANDTKKFKDDFLNIYETPEEKSQIKGYFKKIPFFKDSDYGQTFPIAPYNIIFGKDRKRVLYAGPGRKDPDVLYAILSSDF